MDLVAFRPKDPDAPEKGSIARSFSGHERNRMFIQTDDNFDDVTLVSGADFRNDSRGFALFDYDHDGWLDLGVTSPQKPRFQIFRNTIGDSATDSPNRSTYISLEGGHRGTNGQIEWSSRDAVGAMVMVTIGETKRMYQVSSGEGLATQNSKWIHIGMGQAEKIDRLEITWPSGKQTSHNNVAAGSRVTLHEDGRISE